MRFIGPHDVARDLGPPRRHVRCDIVDRYRRCRRDTRNPGIAPAIPVAVLPGRAGPRGRTERGEPVGSRALCRKLVAPHRRRPVIFCHYDSGLPVCLAQIDRTARARVSTVPPASSPMMIRASLPAYQRRPIAPRPARPLPSAAARTDRMSMNASSLRDHERRLATSWTRITAAPPCNSTPFGATLPPGRKQQERRAMHAGGDHRAGRGSCSRSCCIQSGIHNTSWNGNTGDYVLQPHPRRRDRAVASISLDEAGVGAQHAPRGLCMTHAIFFDGFHRIDFNS